MLAKIKHLPDKATSALQHLADGRLIGLGLFVVVALLIAYNSVKVIETNWRLQKDVAQTEQQNQLQELANQNMKLQNEYYDSPQYLDIAARSTFGLAAEGETVLIVPESTAMRYIVDLPGDEPAQAADTNGQPAYQRNFQAWMDFFLNRER